jgi:predicted ATPase/DNA-binding SARP family transcriptional activator
MDVRIDGERITTFKYAKVRALLAYLALESHRPQPRASLAAQLWPDQPERAARSSLSQALATLRNALGEKTSLETVLIADVESVQLNPDAIQVDATQFLALLRTTETHAHRSWRTCTPCIRQLEQAVALYRGNFLAELSIADSSIFEEWAGLQREHLRQRALSAYQHLAEWEEWRGRYPEAIQYVRRQVALEPFLEVNHRHLLRLLALNDEQAAALAHFKQLQGMLSRELQIEPELETTALNNQILQNNLSGLLPQPPFFVPIPPTQLVGRFVDLEAIITRLQEGVSALTVTGTAGIGKTRLALEVAHSLHFDFEDGVYFVELAPLNDAAQVAAAITHALGVKERPGQNLQDALITYLRSKHLLLVLDNFEHVYQAATLISDLLGVCPGVKFLVTSRKPLNLRAEHQFPLGSLAEEDALQLFEQRTQAAGARTSADRERQIDREICQRLDRLPLAIELFAAQARLLSSREMLAQIEKPLQALAHGLLDLPARHQTLRAAIQWSYDLLKLQEQFVFRHTGVFAGGFTVENAQAVVGEMPPLLSILRTLQDSSLLQLQEVAGEARFTMLETLREFALEQLSACGEADAARQRHAEAFLSLAELARPELLSSQQKEWFDRLDREHGNLRVALLWSQSYAVETNLRLATELDLFWDVRGHAMEGRKWLREALQLNPHAQVETQARALLAEGMLAFKQDDYSEANVALIRARQLFLQTEDPARLTRVLYYLGLTADSQADYPTAQAYFQEGLNMARGVQDWSGEAAALNGLARIAAREGDLTLSCSYDEQALAIYQEHHALRDTAGLSLNLGIDAYERGDYDNAQKYIESALTYALELGDHYLIILCQLNLGNIQIALGDFAAARAGLEATIASQRVRGETIALPEQLGTLGRAMVQLGEFQAARACQTEALALRLKAGDRLGVAVSLGNLAQVELSENQPGRAALFMGAADAIREAIRSPVIPARRAEHEGLLVAVRTALGQAAFAAAWAEGRALALDQVSALAFIDPKVIPADQFASNRRPVGEHFGDLPPRLQ